MTTYWKTTAFILAALAVPAAVHADIIQLQDGRSISGEMKRVGDGLLITRYDGSKVQTTLGNVTRITLTASPEEQAAVAWSGFMASVNRAADIQTVLALHQQYLEQNPQSPHAAEVQTSLAEYQKLAQQSPVKFCGRWMSSAQVPVLLEQWREAAAPALRSYKSGALAGALNGAQQALKSDSQNSNAMEIAGLASMRLDRLGDAAKYFQALADAEPGNGLAWHNLAVIDTYEGRQAQALFDETRALQAMPANRLLLDNIAGVLMSYPGDRSNAAYQGLSRQFAQAEVREEAVQAGRGLFRYGTTWLPQPVLSQYLARDTQLGDALAKVDDLGHQGLDDQSQSRLEAYKSALLAVDKSRTAFVPQFMDYGEDAAPPAPVALASPAPLPRMPDFSAPAIATTTNTSTTTPDDSSTVPSDSPVVYVPPIGYPNSARGRDGQAPWHRDSDDHGGVSNDRDDRRDRAPADRNQGTPAVQTDRTSSGRGEPQHAPEAEPVVAPVQFAPAAPSFGGVTGTSSDKDSQSHTR